MRVWIVLTVVLTGCSVLRGGQRVKQDLKTECGEQKIEIKVDCSFRQTPGVFDVLEGLIGGLASTM